MKKSLLSMALLSCAFAVQAQQVNGSFDAEWEKCYPWEKGAKTTQAYGTTPQGWTVSNVPNAMVSSVGSAVTEEGINGFSVQLKNVSAAGQNTPAYVTLGTSWATAETKLTSVRNADGGAFGGIDFPYCPDGVRLRYKRDMSNGEERASVIAYLWKGTWTQADVPSNTAVGFWGWGAATKVSMTDRDRNILGKETTLGGAVTHTADAQLIASVEEYITESTSEWTVLEAIFDYGDNVNVDMTGAKLNIIIAATDYFADRNGIKKDNSLTVDDVEMIYYSQLASLQYKGVSVEGFDKNKYEYSVAEPYDATKLHAIADGKGATVKTSYDAATGKCVVRVEGNDISANASNYHEYTIQFPVITSFANPLSVSINGTTGEPQDTEIQLVKEVDDTYSFVLKNFMLVSDGSALPIGNIRLTNLTVNGNMFTADQTIQILHGDLEGIAEEAWYGPLLPPVPVVLKATKLSETEMVADIDIDMIESIKQMIKVVFAPMVEINGTEEVPALNGLYNIKLSRPFVAGWNTVCLPFAYQTSVFGGDVKAQAFDSATEAGLNFVAVEDGVLAANTPYLINFPSATTMPVYFGVNIESTTPQSVTHGDFTFTGTYAAVTDMAGKYGVAKINGEDKITKGAAGSTLKATRAYFTTSGADVQSVSLFFDGEATGIEAVETAGEKAFDVYTISGVQVRRAVKTLDGLQKGIYIVNGKKQVVK